MRALLSQGRYLRALRVHITGSSLTYAPHRVRIIADPLTRCRCRVSADLTGQARTLPIRFQSALMAPSNCPKSVYVVQTFGVAPCPKLGYKLRTWARFHPD